MNKQPRTKHTCRCCFETFTVRRTQENRNARIRFCLKCEPVKNRFYRLAESDTIYEDVGDITIGEPSNPGPSSKGNYPLGILYNGKLRTMNGELIVDYCPRHPQEQIDLCTQVCTCGCKCTMHDEDGICQTMTCNCIRFTGKEE